MTQIYQLYEFNRLANERKCVFDENDLTIKMYKNSSLETIALIHENVKLSTYLTRDIKFG
jgi:hypothetical protein